MKLLLLVLVAGCAAVDAASACGPTHGTVVRVIDGDTIVLASGEKIRYLLVDTNEITSGRDDCYGPEAKAVNQSLVEKKEVEIEYDSVCTDIYGRLLGYVTVDGRDVNALLVERGYACVLYIPPDGASRRGDYEALQAQAMAAGAGMWGACPVVACAE